MRVWFHTDRIAARRGEAVTLEGFVANTFDRAFDVSYALDSDPQLHWSVLGPSTVEAGTTTPLRVEVQVPRDLPRTDTSVPVELVVQLGETDLEARAGATIDLVDEPRGCAAFTSAPTVRLNPDGTATLTASIINCGPFDLSVDLRVRHADGWKFDVDASNITLSADAGPVEVTAVIGRSGKVTLDVGDTLQIEVTADGDVLTSATLSVRPSANSWRQRVRRVVSSVLVAGVVVLAVAILGPRLFAGEQPAGSDEPEAPPVLTVTKAGDGAGTITGDGITCGAQCSTTVEPNTQLTLTAEPADGSTFDGWSGPGCDDPSATTCTVTIDRDQTLTATFTIEPTPPPVLTVTKTGDGAGTITGDGITCGAQCSTTVEPNTQLTLTAEPADGLPQAPLSTFGGWSGSACDGQTSTSCTVTMDGDKSVSAEFNAVVID
jgi:uncharacterized repeat protein (TIGR02543 family)